MEGGEISNCIKVWLIVFVSLSYCCTIGKYVPKGIVRLLTIIPTVCIFFALPLNLNSIHFVGITAFFIAWLANFKLLLFAFGKGPLSSNSSSSISLPKFIAIGCLPIKIQQHPSQIIDPKSQIDINPSLKSQIQEDPSKKIDQNSQIDINPSLKTQIQKDPSQNPTEKCLKSPLNYTIKVLLLAIIVRVYDYSEYIHPTVICTLYGSHIYIILEITLAIVAAMAEAILGLKLEPQFNEPYLATSLQNFWGRRWNIVVSSTILRPTVYEPVLNFCSNRIMGRKWASLPAVFTTFLVSGLMHELMFFYMGREKPTWEVTWFFVLHGVYVMVEIVLKKKFNGIYTLPPLISRFFTFVFLVVTLIYLFFPQFLRYRVIERAFEECTVVGVFAKDVWSRVCMKNES